jgi:MSHA pilin protein MshC
MHDARCRGAGDAVRAIMRERRAHGYTIAELIAVVVITGVLAAVAAPRFLGRQSFDGRAFHDQCLAVVRHAQKVAIAQRRTVYVSVTSARIGACYDAGCASHVPPPVSYLQPTTPWGSDNPAALNCGNDPRWLCAGSPGAVSISPAITFSFDGLGRPSLAATQTLSVSGDVTRPVIIERETGYVHP